MQLLHISVNAALFTYCILFLHKLVFWMTILILFVFLSPISNRFWYLDHLVANRMAPSMCLDPCGTRWCSWFQAILYHISATYLVFMRSAYFFKKMPHKTDVLMYLKMWHSVFVVYSMMCLCVLVFTFIFLPFNGRPSCVYYVCAAYLAK